MVLYVSISFYTCLYTSLYVYLCVYVCVYIYIYICIYVYIHIHISVLSRRAPYIFGPRGHMWEETMLPSFHLAACSTCQYQCSEISMPFVRCWHPRPRTFFRGLPQARSFAMPAWRSGTHSLRINICIVLNCFRLFLLFKVVKYMLM